MPKREATAMPTATTEATAQITPPIHGSSDTAPSAANPAASAAGRRDGETLFVSFWPRRRNSAPIPKILAATPASAAARASGTESAAGRRAKAAAAARNRVATASAPAASEPDQLLSAEAAARAKGDPKK